MTDKELQECLLRGYGYRKTTQLRGEYIVEGRRVVSNTLHEQEVWVRDRSEQPSMNDEEDEEIDEEAWAIDAGLTWPGRTCGRGCGYCGRCT